MGRWKREYPWLMTDFKLRLLKRRTLAAPGDMQVKDKYIAALERVAGIASSTKDDLVSWQAECCLQEIKEWDKEHREKNKDKKHLNTDLMYSISGVLLSSTAHNAVKVIEETIEAIAKDRGFDLQAIDDYGALIEGIETQVLWNIQQFSDPDYGYLSGQIEYIMVQFCWDCGAYRGYQGECPVCYPEFANNEI